HPHSGLLLAADERGVPRLVLVADPVPGGAVLLSRAHAPLSAPAKPAPPLIGASVETYGSLPNQSATSRAADSGESEPCTRLSGIESARSPRIVPGGESAGFVEPIVDRTTGIAPSPSSTTASVGAEVMTSTSSPKNGFSACSA